MVIRALGRTMLHIALSFSLWAAVLWTADCLYHAVAG
jgi:hypothetical protein